MWKFDVRYSCQLKRKITGLSSTKCPHYEDFPWNGKVLLWTKKSLKKEICPEWKTGHGQVSGDGVSGDGDSFHLRVGGEVSLPAIC